MVQFVWKWFVECLFVISLHSGWALVWFGDSVVQSVGSQEDGSRFEAAGRLQSFSFGWCVSSHSPNTCRLICDSMAGRVNGCFSIRVSPVMSWWPVLYINIHMEAWHNLSRMAVNTVFQYWILKIKCELPDKKKKAFSKRSPEWVVWDVISACEAGRWSSSVEAMEVK